MKKVLFTLTALLLMLQVAVAQHSEKESKGAAKERHKKFWKKVGKDQSTFWKKEHEEHVAKQEERKARKESKRSHEKKAAAPGRKKG